VKPISGGSTLRMVFHIGKSSTLQTSQCQLFLYEGNRIDFSVDSTSYYGRGNISSITYGSWNHIAMTVDFAGSTTFKMYVNGADVTTGHNMSTRSAFATATDEIYVGESKTGYLNPFDGNIDEFAIFPNTVLSASNVTTIYNSGTPNDISSFSPSIWWRMGDNDSGSGVTITDQGSASVDGTLTNGASFVSDVP